MDQLQTLFVRTVQIILCTTLFLVQSADILAAENKASTAEPYQLGVFPFLPPRELEDIFAPFAASIGQALGHEVQFNSTVSYLNFMERVDGSEYDIAFVQPFDYVRLADKYHYVPLAVVGERLFAVFVVKQGSPIKQVEDLKGKTVAMPPAVAAISRIAVLYLAEHGLKVGDNYMVTNHRSHSSCLQQVLIGAADACAAAMTPIQFIQQRMKVKFQEIARTREIPNTLFVANPRVPEADRRVILETIMSWPNSDMGKSMLKRARMKPFMTINDKEYDVIRHMIKEEGTGKKVVK